MTAALALTVALPGLDPITVALSRYRQTIADWTPFWRDRFAPAFYGNVLRDFVLEGGNTGARWAPLSEKYAAWKRQRFPGAGILVRSGALKASLLGPSAPYSIFRPTATSLEIGSSVPYGIYHQLGATWMRANAKRGFGTYTTLPQRPPLRVDDAFMGVMGKAMQQFIQAAWQDARSGFVSVVSDTPVLSGGVGGGGLRCRRVYAGRHRRREA